MFNDKGELIGIVSYILSKSGGFEGLGFAATSNMAKKLLLEETPFWTGMEGMMVVGKLAGLLNIPQSGGFLVQKVSFVSPAANAGLRGGDVNIIIGGQELLIGGDILLSVGNIKLDERADVKEVYDFLSSKKGGTFNMKFLREGRIVERDFELK